MDFHNFPKFLGKSGMDLIHPPKFCAGLVHGTAPEPPPARGPRYNADEDAPALVAKLLGFLRTLLTEQEVPRCACDALLPSLLVRFWRPKWK